MLGAAYEEYFIIDSSDNYFLELKKHSQFHHFLQPLKKQHWYIVQWTHLGQHCGCFWGAFEHPTKNWDASSLEKLRPISLNWIKPLSSNTNEQLEKKWDEGKKGFWLNCPSALQLTFAVSSPVSSAESPVYVVLADVNQVFVVGAVEELLFCH